MILLSNYQRTAEYDKIYKIRPLIEMVNGLFAEAVIPEGAQSIDEQMILFTGRKSPNECNSICHSNQLAMVSNCGRAVVYEGT